MTKDFIFQMELSRCHFLIPASRELKKDQRTERYFWEEKEKLLEIGNRVSESNKCLFLYHEILMSKPKSFNLDHKENFEQKNIKLILRNTKDIALEEQWRTT